KRQLPGMGFHPDWIFRSNPMSTFFSRWRILIRGPSLEGGDVDDDHFQVAYLRWFEIFNALLHLLVGDRDAERVVRIENGLDVDLEEKFLIGRIGELLRTGVKKGLVDRDILVDVGDEYLHEAAGCHRRRLLDWDIGNDFLR